MPAIPRPISLIAERAVRYLREHAEPVNSVKLAELLLATRIADETTARQVLESVFGGDPRLSYADDGWRRATSDTSTSEPSSVDSGPDPDRVLVLLKGGRPARGQPFVLSHVAAIRLHGDDVVSACGGEPSDGASGDRLRRMMLETLEDAVPVVHDPPGSLHALEKWLDGPIEEPISLRRLAQSSLNLPANHGFQTLLGALKIGWRESDDPLEFADALDSCLGALRAPGESLLGLRDRAIGTRKPISWSGFDFDKRFLRSLPHVPGTYRFLNRDGEEIYVGKAKDLNRRVGSYFRRGTRSARVQELLDELYRIEIEPAGSDLEAMLREAQQIRRRKPKRNVQRQVHARTSHDSRLSSILILEPATSPLVLRAYLIRDGRLVGRIGIGPRGGGLKRIERLLHDQFFSISAGPTPVTGPDVDVELVARWLSGNRDQVVAFDPTDMPSPQEVTDRLRWFLSRGTPFDPDGMPIMTR